ncbi:MAG TPA: hypothetical protein VNI77_06355, partial [Nitrososphaera sp.]|nr:hypothetical protein [Nitrososphaera sp.]
ANIDVRLFSERVANQLKALWQGYGENYHLDQLFPTIPDPDLENLEELRTTGWGHVPEQFSHDAFGDLATGLKVTAASLAFRALRGGGNR